MPRVAGSVVALLITLLASVPFLSAQEAWPDPGWEPVPDLEAAGWSPDKLARARRYADSVGTAAYLVIEHGRVVDSHGDVTHRYRNHSVRKSLLSLLYGIAADRGEVPLDVTLGELDIDDYGDLTGGERRATLRQLLQSRSGVYLPAAYENEAYDGVRPARGSHRPGEHWFYSNWDFNASGTIYQLLTGRNIFSSFRDQVAGPLGMQDFDMESLEWRYDTRSWHPAYLFRMSSRDLARVGLLYLREGRWKEQLVVSTQWIERTTRAVSDVTYPDGRPLPGACFGWMWWVPCPEDRDELFGSGMFNAVGTGEQVVSVIPARDLVFVHRTDTDLPSSEYRPVSHQEVMALLRRVLAAKGATPAPPGEPGPEVRPLDTPTAPDLPDTAVALPNPKGPYQVGTVSRALRLDAPEPLTGDATDRRELVVQLFYPARRTRDMAPAEYMPRLAEMERGLRDHGFPPFRERADRLPVYERVQTAAWPGEPILSGDGPFPVLLFSPGANVSRHWYTGLVQELASHGYVVAVMSHAHSSLDVFPEAGFLASHAHWHPGPDVPADERAARDHQLSDRLAGDARAALDYLERLAATDSSLGMRGALDLARVAVVGHSRGGSTVTRACATDRRLQACVVLDNIGSHPETGRGLEQPQLAIRAPWAEARAGRLHRFLEANRSAAFEVVLPGAKHMSFTDVLLVDPEAHPPGELGPLAAHRTIAVVILGFLEEYLRDGHGGFRSAVAGLESRAELREF